MKRCEQHQMEMSALLDGESHTAAAVTTLDHVSVCPACRDFWTQLRAFQTAVDALPAANPAVSSTVVEEGRRRSWLPAVAWAWPVAALLLLAIGLSVLRPSGAPVDDASKDRSPYAMPGRLTVQLGADPDAMDRERFFAFATELLEAGAVYRSEMGRLLAAADAVAAPPAEARLEPASETNPAADGAAPERTYREHRYDRLARLPDAIPN